MSMSRSWMMIDDDDDDDDIMGNDMQGHASCGVATLVGLHLLPFP